MNSARLGLLPLAACLALLAWASSSGDSPPQNGPATEKRFPPLQVPAGFKATLFACDPLIEYPSAIAAGPRPGSLLVAVDYMTGLGTDIVRRDEIRLIEDTNGDGYADRSTVYADGFNSIEGMTYHDGTVYAMHSPLLTALRDTNGDGKADERRDLLTGLGLPPEQNPVRLHCANGCVMGHDRWLYMALGDHGCDVRRPEGDRLVLEGGGILRCRPDGRDLHVFATGLRNIYDVALDEELNVFVRDNENDGGDYKVRVCHSFFGADHGYPYLYYERPAEALPPLADLGLGSSAGGLAYLEPAFPAEHRGNLFFCEWGRAVMRCAPRRAGSSFAPLKEVLFAAGAENDPYGFKPTDLAVQSDGALFIADWCDGQRPKRGRGRIYRITAAEASKQAKPAVARPAENDLPAWIARLDSASYHERCEAQTLLERQGKKAAVSLREALAQGRIGALGRLHAAWVLAHVDGNAAIDDLLNLARTDREPRVRAQAIRAVADVGDPVLAKHRLEAGKGDMELAKRLAAAAKDQDPQVVQEVIVALGRLRWEDSPKWLGETLRTAEPAMLHAAIQTLRRSGKWAAVLKLLDEEESPPVRAVALRAAADQYDADLVDGLIERLERREPPARRREYADLLTRVYRRRGPWQYWGYRPPPRPAHTVAWERTEAIAEALHRALLTDADPAVRLAILRRMQREAVPVRLDVFRRWLPDDQDAETVAVMLEALRRHPKEEIGHLLAITVAIGKHTTANRLAALEQITSALDASSMPRFTSLASGLEDGPVLAAALAALGKQRPQPEASALLLSKLKSPDAAVRAAAIEALGNFRDSDAAKDVASLLEDRDGRVRAAAATAAGKLAARSAAEPLLRLVRDADPAVRRASYGALSSLKEPRAVPLAVAAVADPETRQAALRCIADLGSTAQAAAVVEIAGRDQSAEVLSIVIGMLSKWSEAKDFSSAQRLEARRAIARVQGTAGALVRWHVAGPLQAVEAATLVERSASPSGIADSSDVASPWRTLPPVAIDSRVVLDGKPGDRADATFLAYADLVVPEPMAVQLLGTSNGTWRVWLNGKAVHHREGARALQPDSERFDASLAKGANRLLVQLTSAKPEFQLRFRRKNSLAEHERLAQAALMRAGNADRGRQILMDAEKSQCLKCHRLGSQGERIGPELTGLGGRFSRMHVIESILEPSRAIGPSFQAVTLLLSDGRVLTGLILGEQDGMITLADNQGRKHVVAKSAIEQQQPSPLSAMPDGLEKRLTPEEFVDLIAFLAAQK